MKMYSIHIVLLLSLLFSQLYNSTITALYELNYDYYSTVLCENKAKPEMHCNGKCYFAKQLQLKEYSQDTTDPPVLLPTLALFANCTVAAVSATYVLLSEETLPSYLDLRKRSAFLPEIDHPPRA